MMSDNQLEYRWFYAYGRYRDGKNGLPHFGDVIRSSLKVRGITKQQFAAILECSKRYVDYLTSEDNYDMPKNDERRAFIAKVLGIAPVLLGVPFVGGSEPGDTAHILEAVDERRMQAYQDMLEMAWSLYYAGDFQQATKHVGLWIEVLKESADTAKGVDRDQLRAMLVRFLHLGTNAARDRMMNTLAEQRANEALAISKDLANLELIVSSHYHRARVYLQLGKEADALADLLEAEKYVDGDNVSDVIVGTMYTGIGEAYAAIAEQDPSQQTTALHWLDKAANIARTRDVTPEGVMLIQFELSRVMSERAATFSLFGMKSDARNSLAIAKKTLPVGNVRWQKDYLLSEADFNLYIDGNITDTAQSLISALKLHDATHSKSNLPYIMRLYHECRVIEPNNAMLAKLGINLGVL
jgi:tetratricopeptide (TPR) repeat protein